MIDDTDIAAPEVETRSGRDQRAEATDEARPAPPFQKMSLGELETEIPRRTPGLRRALEIESRERHAQAGHDVRDPRRRWPRKASKSPAAAPGGAARRLRLPAQPRSQLSSGSGRYLCLAVARSAASVCAPATLSRGGRPLAARRRALLRPGQGRPDQFREPGHGRATRSPSTTLTPLCPGRSG